MATAVSKPQTSSLPPADDSVPQEAKPTLRPRKRKPWTNSMKFVRRVHLYSGIFMLPFVLLYGITGWLFNHPGYFSGDETTAFVGTEVADGRLTEMTTPGEMASQIVAAINAQSDGEHKVELTTNRRAEYTGFLWFSAKGKDNASHFIKLDPNTGDGEVRTSLQEKTEQEREEELKKSNPLSSINRVQIDQNGFKDAQATLPDVLAELGFEQTGEVKARRRSPSLSFSATIDGEPAVVSYNLENGAVSAIREDSLPETKTKNFLLRLHKSRTYSPYFNVRWFWALLVDGMVISMVFWGLSGLIMWWQIKRTRLLGGGFLVASIICTSFLVTGMHHHGAVSSGLRNSRPREKQRERSEQTKTKNLASAKAKP